MSARPVRAGGGAYAVAVAELPLRARLETAASGSIVVISGEPGWGARLRRAVEDGAAAIILAEPKGIDGGEFREAGSLSIPVVVDRVRLRPDVVDDARPSSPPRAVQVEAGATEADTDAVLRDAIGWARCLAGGLLDFVASSSTPRGLLLAMTQGPIAASVIVGHRDAPAVWLRALAIDSDRSEVTLQHPVGSPVVTRSGSGGIIRMPSRFESHERLALRRALDALEGDALPRDLSDLEHDSTLAAQLRH